ncbi:MAG TPA: SRPBCC family protein [Caulobacterales bacterium]|nr:SRPBCC family protein [Caulobacterales bacterium]
MDDDSGRWAKLSPLRAIVAVVLGCLAGVVLVAAPYAFARYGPVSLEQYSAFSATAGISLTILLPFVQGFVLALTLGPKRYHPLATAALVGALVLIQFIGAAAFLHEGVICLIILSLPLITFVALGAVAGRWLARIRSTSARKSVQVSLLPLVVLAVVGEASGPRPDHEAAVTDSIVIAAPPEYVWRYVVQYPENTSAPEYWLWRLGLPAPVQSVAQAPRVGAARSCRFSDGVAFEERITELTPNQSMTFEVTKQPDHPEVTGHFRFDRGRIALTRTADGATKITATSWYRLQVRPGFYFDWWTADITRQVHFRVLNHMKRLAERDYAAAHN